MKIIITVLLAAFILASCMPTNQNVPPETMVSTPVMTSTSNSSVESWTPTPLVDTPTTIPTVQPTLTLIPTWPNGVLLSKIYNEESYGEAEYSIISTLDGGYLIIGRPNYGSCSIRKLDSAGEEEWKYSLAEVLGDEFVGHSRCFSPMQMENSGYAMIAAGMTCTK